MTTVEVLQKAREMYAANPSHAPLDGFPRDGTVCVITALDKACRDGRTGFSFYEFGGAEEAFRNALGFDEVVAFNAEHSTYEVLAVFDKAIEAVAA